MFLWLANRALPGTGPQPDSDCNATETRFIPRGYGPKGITRRKFSTVEWAKREDVTKAWAELAEEHGLVSSELRDVERVFGEFCAFPESFICGGLCLR